MRKEQVFLSLIILLAFSFLLYVSYAQTETIANPNFTSDASGWAYGEADASGVASGTWDSANGHYDPGCYYMLHNDSDTGSNPTSEQWINYSFSLTSVPNQTKLVAWYRLVTDDDTDYHAEVRLIHSNGTEFVLYVSSTVTTAGDTGWTEVSEDITDIVDATGTYTVKLYVQTGPAPENADRPTNEGYWDDVQVYLYYPPKWHEIYVNDSDIRLGDVVEHQVRWTDEAGMSYAFLEVNGTGANCDTLGNVSSTTLSGNDAWSNLSWIIPSACEGKVIGWRIYANDTSNMWNATPTQSYQVKENTPPYYTSVQANDTTPFPGDAVKFSALWFDNMGLDYWTFSWNASGNCDTWENVTISDFLQPNNSWSNVTQIIPSACSGKAVGWMFYANDTSGNSNATGVNVIDVQAEYISITLYNGPICFGSVDAGREYPASDGSVAECGSGIKGFPLMVEIDSNVNTDIWLSGSGDLTDGVNTIPLSNLKYNESSNPSYKTGLSMSYQIFKSNIPSGLSNHSIYWWLEVPVGQAAGGPYATNVTILVNKTS